MARRDDRGEAALFTPVRALGAALLGLLLLAGVLTYRDATAVRDGLRAAEAELVQAERALADEDFASASALLAEAAEHAAGVDGRVDGPVWAAVSLLPRVGDAPALARAAADLVLGTAAIGDEGLALAAEVLDPDTLSGLVDGSAVNIAVLRDLADRADQIDLTALETARDELAATDPTRLPRSLALDRDAALRRAEGLLGTLDAAQTGLDAVIDFVGGNGPRSYLVVAQNNAELRGTGGLIGFLTELTFDDGRAQVSDGVSLDIDDDIAQRTSFESPGNLPPPVDRPDEFAERYDHVGGGQYLGSVNLDPDLPTVGPVLLRLYEQQFGRRLDGVLAVDPLALGGIVQATRQPVDLEPVLREELPAAAFDALPDGLPLQMTGAEIPQFVMIDGYDVFQGGGPAKKAFDKAVIAASLDRFLSGDWEARRMVNRLRQLLGGRHLQLYATDEATQTALEAAGVAGQLPDSSRTDVLAVTGANAAPNKADVHVRHTISGEISLHQSTAARELQREASVRVTVDNPLSPGDHHDYITGSYPEPVGFGTGRPDRVDEATVRTWLSLWTPGTALLRSVRDTVGDQALRTDELHGLRAVDVFLDTPSQTETAFEVPYGGPVAAQRTSTGWVYELVLWRQAKGIPDLWDLRISAPDGHRVATATVTGGQAVQGLSDVELVELTATVDGDDVLLRGHSSEDALLRIEFVRTGS